MFRIMKSIIYILSQTIMSLHRELGHMMKFPTNSKAEKIAKLGVEGTG